MDNIEEGQKELHKEGGPGNNMKRNTHRLTLQQKIFCEAYVSMGPYAKAVKAAVKAGYKAPEKSIGDLMAKPEVQEYIDKMRLEARMRNNITIDDLINETAKIAFFDIRSVFNEETGKLKLVKDMDDVAAAAIAEINTDQWDSIDESNVTETKKVKLRDKLAAITMLRDMLGYRDKEKEKKTLKDAEGNIVGSEETEYITESQVVFKDFSGKVNINNGNL